MAKLARVLKTDVMGDLSAIAQLLQSRGRGKDTILAHITPKEAERLKAAGGRGSRNPDTGLLEFDDQPAPVEAPPAPTTPAQGTIAPEVTVTSTPTSSGGDYTVAPSVSAAPAAAVSAPDYSLTAAPSYQSLPSFSAPSTLGTPTTGPLAAPALAQDISAQATTPELEDVTVQSQKLQDPYAKTTLQKLESSLGGPQGLARLGIAGLGGILGITQARKASQQAQAAQQQEQALATPYQEQGRALTGAAAQGQLSPASMQAYQAAQARLQQQAAASGGVGVAQQAAEMESFRQQLLANQFQMGLQVSSIGDQIALGAIQTGMQADTALANANNQFYTQLASIAVGLPIGGRTIYG